MLVLAVLLCASVALWIVVMLLAIFGPIFTEMPLRAKVAVQGAWWGITVAAMIAASAWWRQDPASSFRTLLAVVSCIAMPGLGVNLAVRTVLPPANTGSPPWYALPRGRASAGSGALRNARLRRD